MQKWRSPVQQDYTSVKRRCEGHDLCHLAMLNTDAKPLHLGPRVRTADRNVLQHCNVNLLSPSGVLM